MNPQRYFVIGCLVFAAFAVTVNYFINRPQRDLTSLESELFPETHFPERHTLLSESACIECHREAVEEWRTSQHAQANRKMDSQIDISAFELGSDLRDGESHYRFFAESGGYYLEKSSSEGDTLRYPLQGVIALYPLRQYLVELEGGRLQATSLAFDPRSNDWFNIFEDGRRAGEWGHWTGQGMNWNANCAYCHMTEFKKNYDVQNNHYKSTWLQQGISCAQCHGGLEEHLKSVRSKDPNRPVYKVQPQVQMEHTCAACHSRRNHLTAEGFKPGDSFHDHFELALPVREGLYYPDGQIRDEVFEHTSFHLSKMGHAGISCLECHQPHSFKLTLPIVNNALCMKCHSSGLDNAPIIEPLLHSRHTEGSTGNRCVECHMTHTTYMARDDRRDHAFTLPDPLMTRELGIPNACNKCHADQSVDWAVEHAEEWYGAKLAESRQRKRARIVDSAYRSLPEASARLLDLARDEPNHTWRATYAGLLGNLPATPEAEAFLKTCLNDVSSLVRMQATYALANYSNGLASIQPMLRDDYRNVRMAAAFGFASQEREIPDARAAEEWKDYLQFNSDQPINRLLLASESIRKGDTQAVLKHLETALSFDAANPELIRQNAIMVARAGNLDQALLWLQQGAKLDPQNSQFPYSIGLLYAEKQDYGRSAVFLERATRLDPDFYRAWYNLALAHTRLSNWEAADEAIRNAASGMAQNPDWQKTFMIIQRSMQNADNKQ